MTTQEEWNPDQACREMAELFRQADEITSQPHYQDVASTDSLTSSGADASQPTDVNES